MTFDNSTFGKLPILMIDTKPHFGATEAATILGYSNPQKAIRDHCLEAGCTIRSVSYPSGTKRKKFITEGNLYRLITHSHLPSAEKFESWVFDEVLPSIRKNGTYMTPQTIEQTLNDPDFIIRLAQRLKDEQEARRHAEGEVETMKPKALFADAVETSRNSILIGELAKLLKQNGIDIGQNRLFRWLREHGYLCQRGGFSNTPTQKAMNLKLFEIKERVINNPDGSARVTRTTKVTGKGQIYFINKFLKEVS